MEVTSVQLVLVVSLASFVIVVDNKSLKLYTCRASQDNSTIHVDGNGFLHLNLDKSKERAASSMELITYYVKATFGTSQGRRTYPLAIDTMIGVSWIQCVPCSSSNNCCLSYLHYTRSYF